ncbi:MAG: hypothetical protein NC218_02170 [Acetobacter sp.]|nr:hypothetical protein [Acetobacter sp.]
MGVTIKGNYSSASSYDFGAGQFASLRAKVAKAALGDKYNIYTEWLATDENTPKEELSKKCENFYKNAGDAVYNFCIQSDCGGKLSPKQTRELYEVIKDVDDNWSLQYLFYQMHHPQSKEDFKVLLRACIKNKCGFKWY